MSAHADAVSSYGRTKWASSNCWIPQSTPLCAPDSSLVREDSIPRMLATLRCAPVVPIFYGGTQPIQPIGLDDVD